MKLVPGKYMARIKSYGVGKPQGKAARPPIFIEFELEIPESSETPTLYWWGSMENKSKPESKRHPYEITIDNLIKMGLKGSDPYDVADNKSGALNTFIPYELVVENNEYQGKTSLRIRYINVPGSGGVKEALSGQEARAMAGFSFAGAVLAARQATGIKDDPAPHQPATVSNHEEEDIPF